MSYGAEIKVSSKKCEKLMLSKVRNFGKTKEFLPVEFFLRLEAYQIIGLRLLTS
jgi:hypothetical protein